jgi:non-specific serine/threonine protein kinase
MPPIDPQLAAALADRYRLDRELGAGGMATVYLADDLRHGRKVAVKVLRPDLAAALGRERFFREITTTASLRHPNILPLYDSGEGAGALFYVMPLVEGESLRERLRRESPLPVADALRIADEVADALSYAHGRGIIHRDVKPENILLEHGHAIVADFGIAHAVAASGETSLTMTGMVVGTPQYMSPEQARGEPVDARSDLYALGCLVYEMLAGSPPFTGTTAIAVITRHITDPVPSLRAVRPTITAPVAEAVERALAKAPADRFPTVQEWRAALAGPGAAVPVSVATTGVTFPVGPAATPKAVAVFKPPPLPATPLLGRDEAIAAAAEHLRAGARVLTVTGPGGTGKTRFAIELFGRVQHDYPGGAAFVSLASVTTPEDVMPAVGVALDIAEAAGRSAVDAVATLFGDRPALLLLDNLEQVLGAAGDVAALVARCPALQVVATSQAPLRIGAETEVPLPPLALPPAGAIALEEVVKAPAVALFAQRAAKVKPGFVVTAANAGDVAAICRRLDGLPLALELAAARVRTLEPAALRARLDRALDLLTSGDRDLPERHRTLRATVGWSHSLLDTGEQRLLRRASVFAEGWTLEAMEAVCYSEAERHRALDELDSLVEKGLVQAAGARCSLLETIREFAAERLVESGEMAALRQGHADYFVEFARGIEEGIKGRGQLDSMRRARAENANTQAALHWITDRARAGEAHALEQGLLLCGRLNWAWHIAGQHLTARSQLDALFALAMSRGPSPGRACARLTSLVVGTAIAEWEQARRDGDLGLEDARALGDDAVIAELAMGKGYVALATGRMEEARAALDESIARAAASGAPWVQALALTIKGMLLFVTGDLPAGMALVEEARRIQVEIGDYEGRGLSLSFLAQMIFVRGELARATMAYREALEAFETVGDKPEVARVRCELGWAALTAGDLAEARRWFLRSLRAHDENGSPRGLGQALIGLAATEAADGRPERAVEFAAAAHVMSARAGVVVEHPMAPGISERIETLKAAVPSDALEALVARGRSLTPAAVMAMAAKD